VSVASAILLSTGAEEGRTAVLLLPVSLLTYDVAFSLTVLRLRASSSMNCSKRKKFIHNSSEGFNLSHEGGNCKHEIWPNTASMILQTPTVTIFV
jgi:hypothetical protein